MNVRARLSLFVLSLVTSTSACALAAAVASPSDSYLAYYKALRTGDGKDTNVNDVISYMDKPNIAGLKATQRQIRLHIIGAIKARTPTTVKVVSEKIDGDHATLSLKGAYGTDPNAEQNVAGSVLMVLEDSGWKLSKQSWDTPAPAPTPVIHTPPAAEKKSPATR